VVSGFDFNDFARQKVQATEKELLEEREFISDLWP
jgi:hypothetical protein